MSTPPIPPNYSPSELPPPKPGRSSLAKLAIIFAVTIGVTFGLCTIALMNSNSAMSGPILPAALVIEGICVLGLVVVAILAIVRRSGSN
jgi:hypothetical protein